MANGDEASFCPPYLLNRANIIFSLHNIHIIVIRRLPSLLQRGRSLVRRVGLRAVEIPAPDKQAAYRNRAPDRWPCPGSTASGGMPPTEPVVYGRHFPGPM
jgi:hypothetical protein